VANPFTGRSFVAYRKIDNSDGPWYAADLLDQAKALVNVPEGTELDEAAINNIFGDIELVRLAFNVFGE